jgi:hypothetical protein
MSTTTKSPKKVAAAAYYVARNTLPEHSSRYSPKKFTQPQLMVCLVLKTFFQTDYRGIVQILNDCAGLRKVFELRSVPHFTTLQKASKRLLNSASARDLIEQTVQHAMGRRKTIQLAVVDSTGLQSGHISPYFLKRRAAGKKQPQNSRMTKWPKMALISDTRNHIILAVHMERGPGRDAGHFKQILDKLPAGLVVKTLAADAGYDSEANHAYAHEVAHIKTVIPPKIGRSTDKLPRGKYRRQMAMRFDARSYGQRWQAETVFSMIKRNLSDSIAAKGYWSQLRDIYLLAITHNLLILLWAFQRAFLQSNTWLLSARR